MVDDPDSVEASDEGVVGVGGSKDHMLDGGDGNTKAGLTSGSAISETTEDGLLE